MADKSSVLIKRALDIWFWVRTTNFYSLVVRRTTRFEPLILNTAKRFFPSTESKKQKEIKVKNPATAEDNLKHKQSSRYRKKNKAWET